MPPPRAALAEQSPTAIAGAIESFLAEHPHALLLEDGKILFDLREAKYSLASEHNRCTLHLWSDDRNLVRRITAATLRKDTLRLTTHRFGQTRPQSLELVANRDRRTPSTREATRTRYLRVLERVLLRNFPDWKPDAFRTAMDLEKSFGPAYARGTLVRGQQAWAVIAVNEEESQSIVDGILTLGILWLHHCREHAGGRKLFQRLKIVVPSGMGTLTLSRLAWLNPAAAQWELWELDPRTEDLEQRDPADHGNLRTRLLHAPNETTARERFAESAQRVMDLVAKAGCPTSLAFGDVGLPQPTLNKEATPHQRLVPRIAQSHRDVRETAGTSHAARISLLLPQIEQRLRSAAELAFLLHGLEFARIRIDTESFNRRQQITFGAGAHETELTDQNEPQLRDLVARLFARRSPAASHNDPLYRMQPERWLESILRKDVSLLDDQLDPARVYTQVPAFAASDRGMLDLLGITRTSSSPLRNQQAHQPGSQSRNQPGRLAVIELKADEDLHLALQGLDYWIRVRAHHLENLDPATGLGEFQRHGYFGGLHLSPDPPRLYLVAPALRIHPATETVLAYLDPRVQWTLIALDERWRQQIKVVWRKRSASNLA